MKDINPDLILFNILSIEFCTLRVSRDSFINFQSRSREKKVYPGKVQNSCQIFQIFTSIIFPILSQCYDHHTVIPQISNIGFQILV